ncbi:MAG TPA: sporulation protein YunB [Acetivibrio sp.]|uniref:sporulation protein YunB n=1 Tax=Acetivibrio sp. TaxID=1872092 RepID=UPI002BD31DFA|nr:sporulation protein YunB [Acetivibrio sp.]HOM01475.1 sporulation protein YunB [Acetivibrio sp.]
MRRKTKLYRRLWYLKRNRERLRRYIVIAIIVIVLVLIIAFAEGRIRRSILEISEYRTKSIINNAVSRAVNENFYDDINYDEIVIINRDQDDRINSIQTDIVKLNRIYAGLSLDIQERLLELKDERISIPLGAVFGDSLLATGGPKINVKVIPAGSVETDFKSEFISAGINQTRHRIYLEVKTSVGIAVPFTAKKTEITTRIPVAETVIIGDVPEFYIDRGRSGDST